MASSARVVCWQNREEWLYVYRTLYNFDDPEGQKRGIDRVAAWKSRSMGKLPLAIECTVNLISAHLISTRNTHDQGRLTLAMAIVRFVNGMVDLDQKGKFARSVQTIAEEIGLPKWLVDIRHESAHQNLPSLETLRCGVRASLSWLQYEYWEAQLKIHDGNIKRLIELLEKYRELTLRPSVKSKKKAKSKTDNKLTQLSNSIADTVSKSNLWSLLPSLLFQKGMLVPSCEHISLSSINQSTKDGLFADLKTSEVIGEIFKIWKPLIEALDKSSPEFLMSTIHYLLVGDQSAITDKEKDLSLYYAEWVKHFLLLMSKEKCCEVPLMNILKIALENPTRSYLTIISKILEKMHLIDSSLKHKVLHLVEVFLEQPLSECCCVNDMEEFQESNLEEWMARRSKICTKTALQQDEGAPQWQQGSQQDSTLWHFIPFGEVLGADFELELSV
ncbi:uncharacterized protein [Pocillopora verrucosa]|uniref:uncharacterized protein n=1 Tax=Pocillopora verrucosa TaxID=203993 RepID=UPI0033402419